jgi:hypothetical protein
MRPLALRDGVVGNGNDYLLTSSTPIISARGSFPIADITTAQPGSSLQMNTNTFSSPKCEGRPGCQGWQQFYFNLENGRIGRGEAFIQYWLLGFFTPGDDPKAPCPGTFIRDGDGSPNCRLNSDSAYVPTQHLVNLGNFHMSGSTRDGFDTVTMSVSPRTYYVFMQPSFLGLSNQWTHVEFNAVGDCCGSQAHFGDGTTVGVRIDVDTGTAAAPTCSLDADGATGETNNLSLVDGSCCAFSGAKPGITFMQSNVANRQAPFCLLNDVNAIGVPLL